MKRSFSYYEPRCKEGDESAEAKKEPKDAKKVMKKKDGCGPAAETEPDAKKEPKDAKKDGCEPAAVVFDVNKMTRFIGCRSFAFTESHDFHVFMTCPQCVDG